MAEQGTTRQTVSRPSVSILIPCFNAERWIGQSIQSALDQTYTAKQVIVVDDGSSDGSLEVIQSFGDKIRWETGPNRGGNAARNRLLELATGQWLQYLDADDYLLPDKIQGQINYLSEFPDTDILCSPTWFEEWKSSDGPLPRVITPIPEPRDPWVLLAKWQLPQTGGPLWRRDFLAQAGGWNVEMPCCQEHELYLRLLQSGAVCRFHDEPGAVYRYWSTDSVSRWNEMLVKETQIAVLDRMVNHLDSAGELTQPRLDEVNRTKFRTARWLWLGHRGGHQAILQKIKRSQESFSPGVNPVYDSLYSLFGFECAERVAAIVRNFRTAAQPLRSAE